MKFCLNFITFFAVAIVFIQYDVGECEPHGKKNPPKNKEEKLKDKCLHREDKDDVSTFSELIKRRIFSVQYLEPLLGTCGDKCNAEKVKKIIYELEKKCNPVIRKINTTLTELKNEKHCKPHSIVEAKINCVINNAQDISLNINKAINEIDAQIKNYEEDEKHCVNKHGRDHKGHEEGHGGSHEGHGGGHWPECKPSDIIGLMKLQLGFVAKASLGVSSYKIYQSIINSLRGSCADLSRPQLALLDHLYDGALYNLRYAEFIVNAILSCTFTEPLKGKVQKIFQNVLDNIANVHDIKYKEMIAEYNGNKEGPEYCKLVISGSMFILYVQAKAELDYIPIQTNDKEAGPDAFKCQGIKLNHVVEKIKELLCKCGVKVANK